MYQQTFNHGQKLLRHMKITNVFTLGVNSPLFPCSRLPPLSPFSMLETNKHPQSILQHCFGGRGVTTDEKGVFIQIQNSIVSWKVLVLWICLNTFVHDCCSIALFHHNWSSFWSVQQPGQECWNRWDFLHFYLPIWSSLSVMFWTIILVT